MNILKLLGANGVTSNAISYTYNGTTNGSGTSVTQITITGVAFGSEAAGRIVVIVMSAGSNVTAQLSSVTIGGVSATIATQNTTSFRQNAIIYATVSSGTSGNVVLNYTASISSTPAIFAYSIYNATNSTHEAAQVSINDATGVSATRSVSLTYSNNSVVIGGYSAGAYDPLQSLTWTNATIDSELEAGSAVNASASSLKTTGATTTFQVTSGDTSVNRPALVMASWR